MGLFSSGSSSSAALNWEAIKSKGSGGVIRYTYRTKVPGGWLITAGDNDGMGLTFLPDPNHEWDGNSL